MASESKSTEKKERLPFEPRQNKRKTPKIAPSPVPPPIKTRSEETSLKAIPQAVSQRMAKRLDRLGEIFVGVVKDNAEVLR